MGAPLYPSRRGGGLDPAGSRGGTVSSLGTGPDAHPQPRHLLLRQLWEGEREREQSPIQP